MKELFEFLRELRANNNREWFKSNKARYDSLHEAHVAIVNRLIPKIGEYDPEIRSLEANSCIYRIYRDLRFTTDKTPYKTHFGAYMTGIGGRTSPYAGYYLHLEPDNCLLSGGVWCPTPPMLKRLRRDIFDNAEEFQAILNEPAFMRLYGTLEGEQLKRTPDGFPKDSPFDSLLRYKYYIVSAMKSEVFFENNNWLDQVAEDFKVLYPFNKFLNYTIGEFFGKI